jgi:polyisoprenoid-binding protein YceI
MNEVKTHWISCAAALALVAMSLPDVSRAQSTENKPATLRPGDIHTAASRVYIFVEKTGFGHQHAVVGRLKEGHLQSADSPAGQMVFDMQSFVADTKDARRYIGLEGETDAGTQKQVTANMLGPDVLDVQRFPTARFDVDTVQPNDTKSESGKPQYQIDGKFTLHGVTQPLRFTAEGTSQKGYLHLKGSFPLRQTAYGIRPFSKALGAVGVADELTVYGDLWIKQ